MWLMFQSYAFFCVCTPAGKAGLVPGTKKGVRRWENGFEIHELKMGDPHGKLARAGKKVEVKYIGKLANGKVFDETKGKSTFKFRLGKGSGTEIYCGRAKC
jgi:hypothetical protein